MNYSDVAKNRLLRNPLAEKTHREIIDKIRVNICKFLISHLQASARICIAYSKGHEMSRGEFINPSPSRLAQSIFHPMKALMRWVRVALSTSDCDSGRKFNSLVSHDGETKVFHFLSVATIGGGYDTYVQNWICVLLLYTWITGDGAASAAAYQARYCQEILYPLSPIEISHISTLWSITWNGPPLVPSASPCLRLIRLQLSWFHLCERFKYLVRDLSQQWDLSHIIRLNSSQGGFARRRCEKRTQPPPETT